MKEPKILIFDKFLGYGVGGAQHSFHYLLKNLSGKFKFVGCDVKKSFSAPKYKIEDFDVERIPIKEIPRFPYLEFFINRKRVSDFFCKSSGDFLFAQSLWAPLAINSFSGKAVYFVRDEYNLNRVPNYFSGLKFLAKEIYIFSQSPFLKQFFSDNKKTMEKATLIIANSNFIKNQIFKIFNRQSEVIYPIIDVLTLQKINLPPLRERPFLTLIGSEPIKGSEVVKKIAAEMKDKQFMIVGRDIAAPRREENILYQPWLKDPLEVYKKTKILLVPSLIEEAFARVPVEGAALGIPSLASKKGGMPEFLEEKFLVRDIWNIEEWVEKILDIEKNYSDYAEYLKQKSLKFDAKNQVEKFKKISREKLNLNL